MEEPVTPPKTVFDNLSDIKRVVSEAYVPNRITAQFPAGEETKKDATISSDSHSSDSDKPHIRQTNVEEFLAPDQKPIEERDSEQSGSSGDYLRPTRSDSFIHPNHSRETMMT